jgi:hypothetical protein
VGISSVVNGLALAAIACLTLAACGGGSGSSSAGENPLPGESPSPGESPPPAQPPTSEQPADNSAPQISGTPPARVLVNESYEFVPEAADPDGDTLSFSVSNLPAWAQFDGTTGRLSGTPRQPDIGDHAAITISVSDGELHTALAAFSILVGKDDNDDVAGSATLKWKAPKRNVDGSKLEDLAGYRIYYSQDPANLFNRVEIPERQIIRATIDGLSSGTWYFALTAYTAAGRESELSTIVSKTIG